MVQHSSIDHTGITGTGGAFGSNANQVSTANAPGASTLHSAADHVHRGVSSIAHASNTFYGPVTFTTEGDLGITSPSTGTLAFKAISGGGAAASSALAVGVAAGTGGDFTTASTSYVAVTGMTVTLTTGAHRCLVTVAGSGYNTGLNVNHYTLYVDGVDVTGGNGLLTPQFNGQAYDASFSYVTSVLTAASHTIALYMKVAAGTGYFFKASGTNSEGQIAVIELSA